MAEIETTEHQEDVDEKLGEEGTETSKKTDGADDDTDEGDDGDDNDNDDKGKKSDKDDDADEDADDDQDDDDKKSQKGTSKKEDDDDEEPPVRKRPVSEYIKDRKEKKAAKAAKSSEEDDDDDVDELDDDDKKAITRVAQKLVKPLYDKVEKEAEEAEVKTFLTDNPDFKPYEAKARKYMSHPSRKDVPIEEIFYAVAGKDLLRIGAKRGKIADDKAKETKSSGGSPDAGGKKSVSEMSSSELEAKQNEVRSKMRDRY